MFGLDISHKDFFVLYTEYRFTDKWETLQCHLFFFSWNLWEITKAHEAWFL